MERLFGENGGRGDRMSLRAQQGMNDAVDSLRNWRRLSPVVAWLVALATGWRAWDGADLLNPAIRGAIAWFAVLLVLRMGFGWAEQVVSSAPARPISQQSDVENH